MLTWKLKNILLEFESAEKRIPYKPQSEPKVIQMAFGRPFKTHGIYGMGGTSGFFWRAWELIFVSAAFPSTYSFKFPMTFADLQFKMMPKGESFFRPEWFQMGPFPNKAAPRGHNEFRARSRVLKVLPNGVPGPKNRVQNGVPGSENRDQN